MDLSPVSVACITALAIVLIVLVSGARRKRTGGHSRGQAAHLGRDLASRGWTVYLRRGCGYCDKQMGALGGFGMYILYGEDGALLGGYTKAPPLAPGAVGAFPCWYNTRTGEKRLGLQEAASLELMAL